VQLHFLDFHLFRYDFHFHIHLLLPPKFHKVNFICLFSYFVSQIASYALIHILISVSLKEAHV